MNDDDGEVEEEVPPSFVTALVVATVEEVEVALWSLVAPIHTVAVCRGRVNGRVGANP